MILTFGKYNGQMIDDVCHLNKSYIEWLVKQSWFKKKYIQEYNYCSQCIQCSHKSLENSIDQDTIIIYTDGACTNNGSKLAKAGIGIHFSKRNKIIFDDVSESLVSTDGNKVTNQRAELYAILIALRITKEITNHIIIYTDSEYSINCVMRWFASWVSKNIVDKKKNIDLIRPIYQYYKAKGVEFRHIKSHTGLQDEHSLGNEIADKLATQCIS
jgi:ribonuclease HI